MMQYLIYSSLCSGTLLIVYKLFLEKENMHRFKRFYLLSAILFSYVVPCIVVRKTVEAVSQQFFKAENLAANPVPIAGTINWQFLAIGIFCLVSVLHFSRLIYNLYKIISKVNTGKRCKYQNAILILNTEDQMQHSFLDYIFIGRQIFENTESEKEILHHELAHVNQKHSYDILFVELIRCLFWINPFLYFYKKTIQLNHEFLADKEVNNFFNNVYSYQNLLLQKVSMHQAVNIASQFNYHVTKKRLIMMTKTTPEKIKALKLLTIFPILLVSVYVFGRNVVEQEKIVTQNNATAVQDSLIKPKIAKVKRKVPTVIVVTTHKKLSPLKTKMGQLDGEFDQMVSLNTDQMAPLNTNKMVSLNTDKMAPLNKMPSD